MRAAESAYERYRIAYALPPNVGRKDAYLNGWTAAIRYLVDRKLLADSVVYQLEREEAGK